MNPELLERLLIDRGLGALAPDAVQLLDAYLREHPQEAASARDYSNVASLARRALATPEGVTLPAFPRDRILLAERTAQRWRRARAGLAVAASIVVGFGLAWMALPRTGVAPVDGGPPQMAAAEMEGSNSSSLWSAERAFGRSSPARSAGAPAGFTWTSTGRRPAFGDRS